MSGQRIGGKDIDIVVGDLKLTINVVTLGIEDSIEVVHDYGIPNGWVGGNVSASGDMDLDAQAIAILSEAASSAGSWHELPEFDILFFSRVASGEELKVEAFGCKLQIESLINANSGEGASRHLTKVKFIITSPDFVRINSVPYLSQKETEGVIAPGGAR